MQVARKTAWCAVAMKQQLRATMCTLIAEGRCQPSGGEDKCPTSSNMKAKESAMCTLQLNVDSPTFRWAWKK